MLSLKTKLAIVCNDDGITYADPVDYDKIAEINAGLPDNSVVATRLNKQDLLSNHKSAFAKHGITVNKFEVIREYRNTLLVEMALVLTDIPAGATLKAAFNHHFGDTDILKPTLYQYFYADNDGQLWMWMKVAQQWTKVFPSPLELHELHLTPFSDIDRVKDVIRSLHKSLL